MKNTLAQLLGYEPSESLPTSDSTPKRPARLVALSRSTKGVVGDSFTLNARFAFGNGCDCASYVGLDMKPSASPVNESSAVAHGFCGIAG